MNGLSDGNRRGTQGRRRAEEVRLRTFLRSSNLDEASLGCIAGRSISLQRCHVVKRVTDAPMSFACGLLLGHCVGMN